MNEPIRIDQTEDEWALSKRREILRNYRWGVIFEWLWRVAMILCVVVDAFTLVGIAQQGDLSWIWIALVIAVLVWVLWHSRRAFSKLKAIRDRRLKELAASTSYSIGEKG